MVSCLRRSIECGFLLAFAASYALAQPNSIVCGLTAVPPIVRSEGLAERFGDIVLSCTGRPGEAATGNLTVALNTTISNRLTAGKLDVALTADTGSGPSLIANPVLMDASQLVFAGITFTLGANGRADFRITNLRGDATQISSGLGTIEATLAFSPSSVLTMNGNRVVIAVPRQGLFSTSQSTSVANQIGSPVPEELTFTDLINAKTRFSSTRVTEGFAGAFEPRQGTADVGTRIILRFTGNPPDARLFSPDVIVGANGLEPTAAGDFGGTISGGRSSAGGLVLVRILGTNREGAGGYAASVVGTGPFEGVSEIPLGDGVGIAVYEVVSANPTAIETAQIPVFPGLPRSGEARTVILGREVFFGPTAGTVVPRFKPVGAGTDCVSLGDCSQYVPKLEAYPRNTSFTAVSGANFQILWIPFENVGGGIMVWSARIEYKNGSDWLRVYPTSGFQGNMLRLDVIPMGLAVGTYEATLILDAGTAGVARYPVTLQVKPLPTPTPAISSIGGAATITGPVTGGGLATIKGSNLAGTGVSVTFNDRPARILYSSADQINVQVPSDLAGTTARVVVTANGLSSAAQTINLAAVAPGIFSGGVLNQDGRPNTPEAPAGSSSIVQIFATGLLPATGTAQIQVKLDESYFSGADLPYAAEAPGLPGVQQVNFRVPTWLWTGSYDLSVCATPAGGARVCSPSFRLAVRGN